MKFKRVLKIILLTLSFLFIGLISVFMYMVIFMENEPFVKSMLISIAIVLTGGLGVAYQFKTLQFYNLKSTELLFRDPVLWIGNILFALSQILLSLYLAYILYLDYGTNRNEVVYYICFIIAFVMLVFGICLVLEARNLYNQILKSDTDLFKGSIDDIGGDKVEK